MASVSARNHSVALGKARLLRETSIDRRLRPISHQQAEAYLHASLAANVAAWEAYLEQLVGEFFTVTSNPVISSYHTMHTVAKENALREIKAFNTPNAQNSRELLNHTTGYDPINDWIWPARGMSGPHVRARLDEILRVRHSFAHGLSLPAYAWTQSPAGRLRLGSRAGVLLTVVLRNCRAPP